MSELKPCPFCGGEPYRHREAGYDVEGLEKQPGMMFFVLCSECSALVSGDSQAEADEEWNRRVSDG